MKFLICFLMSFLLCATAQKEKQTFDEKDLQNPAEDDKEFFNSLETYKTDSAKAFFEILMKDQTFREFSSDVEVPRASVDCYYEDCKVESEFIVHFKVRTPPSFKSNGYITATVRYPNGSVANQTDIPTLQSSFEFICPVEGMYEFCLENTVDHLSSKRVSIHMIIMDHTEISHFHLEKQIHDNDTIYHVYDKLYQLSRDVHNVRLGVAHQRDMAGVDEELMDDNNAMIAEFSVAMMILLCAVSFGQVYFLKRLFHIDERPVNGATRKL